MLEDEAFYEEEEEEDKQGMDPAWHDEDKFEENGMSPSEREVVMFDDGEVYELGITVRELKNYIAQQEERRTTGDNGRQPQ